MYLITVARAVEDGISQPVPVAAIAGALEVSAASVNEMVRKLAERGFVEYEPYHGVTLTRSGAETAARVLRTRRLWATFLADHLGFGPLEADEQACHLEHVTSIEASERLAEFLGEPEADPLGKPIPAPAAATPPQVPAIGLDQMAVGQRAEVVSVAGSPGTATFLESEGIKPGSFLTVIAMSDSGLLVEARERVMVTHDLATGIRVRLLGETGA
jgi:DtxR family Mn-dependent transcriptional regulator